MDKVYRLTYVADSYDLITHLYFVDRAKAEAMYREKLEKVSFIGMAISTYTR